MSEATDTINTMELKEKCTEMAEFFLPVFEDYWMEGGKRFDGDVVEFCMYTDNISFQIAFAVEFGLMDLSAITPRGREYIEETYDTMVEGIQEGLKNK